MSGSVDIADILVVVDKGDQFNISLQPPDEYGISINSGDTYVVNIDLPSTVVANPTDTYYRVADFTLLAATASFFGGASASVDWPNITNKPVGLISSSVQINYTNISNIPSGILSSSTQINQLSNVSASFATTSSYALNAGAGAGFPFSGSAIITGSLIVSGGTIVGTSSLAQQIIGGKARYIPLWTGSSQNELTSSIMYQTSKGIFIGYDTNVHFHSSEGETLAVHSGETGVKNVIYAHGTIDDDYRINLRNISSGSSASANFKATADVGNDLGGYVQLGINSSTYSRTDQLGGPLDAYLYTTGSDLLIGTLSPEKRIILFTGPGDADNNARVFVDPSGSVGINTVSPDTQNPEALVVTALTNSYNLIGAKAVIDNYAQIKIKNLSGGNSASADIVAEANNGTETVNYINMGINSDQYNQPNAVGGSNDAYLYSTGRMLHIGNATPGEHIMFFAGGFDSHANAKLILESNNQHVLSGSLNVTGSLNVLDTVINNLTASYAITASYVSGAVSTWNDLVGKPFGLVSSSQQATSWTVLSASFASTASNINFTPSTASFAITASFAPTILPTGIVSSSAQVNYTQLQNIPSGIVSSSAQINTGSFTGTFIGTSSWASNSISSSYAPTNVGVVSSSTQIDFTQLQNKPTLISSSVQVNYPDLQNIPSGIVSSSAQINTGSFSGTFIGTSSWATNAATASRILGGNDKYIPLWNGTNILTSSLLYQTGSSILLGSTEQHTPEAPDRLGVFAGITDSYNLISAHGEIDNYLQLNVKNFSTQSNASSDFVATADTGTEFGGFVNLGINSSNYNISNAIGNALDAYLYSTGSNLLIGNITPGKKIILFNGEGTALDNARVYIDSIGTVSINTGSATPGNPEALLVKAIAFSYNMITAQADINNYAQVNIINKNSGNFASSDFVATANNGNEEQYYIAMGINSENFTGDVGLANDAYLYTTGSNLLVGNIAPDKKLILFAGDIDTNASAKFIIDPDNQHQITGSLTITGSIAVDANVINALTASNAVSSSHAISASYAPLILPPNIVSSSLQINTGSFSGSFIGTLVGTSSWASNAITSSFTTTASAATSITFTPSTASFAITASYAPTILPTGVVSSSTQVNYSQLQNIPVGIVSSSAQVTTLLPAGVVSSSVQINTGSFSGSFTGNVIGTSSWASNAITASYALNGTSGGSTAVTIDTYTFDADGSTVNYVVSQSYDASSLFVMVNGLGYTNPTDYTISSNTITFTTAPVSSSYIVIRALTNVSSGVIGSFSGSFFGIIESSSYATTASFALSASWAPGGGAGSNNWNDLINVPSGLVSSSTQASTWTVASSSVAVSASYAPTILPSGTVSSSTQVNYTQLQNVPSGIVSSSAQVTALLPSGTVSSSLQINTGSFSGSFTGNFIGTSSWASNAVSSSFATTASVATSITFTPTTASFATTASAATSITFTPPTASFATTASAATSITFTPSTASYAISSSTAITANFATSASWAPTVAGAMVPVLDEGVVAVSTPIALNFVGAGVTVTNTSNTASITIPGGSGGDIAAKIVSASYTFGAANEFIFTTGSFTVNVPSAVGIIGRQYQIKNISTGVIFITGSSTIDDYSDITITEKNTSLGLISNGISWSIF